MEHEPDHYHKKLQKEKRTKKILNIVTFILISLVALLIIMETK